MNLIVAADKNWAIGNKGRLLVTIPEDQKLFRPSTPDVIDPPARHINIVSQPIPMPDFDKKDEKPEGQPQDKPEDQSEHGQSKE